jgi:hypothetical protein
MLTRDPILSLCVLSPSIVESHDGVVLVSDGTLALGSPEKSFLDAWLFSEKSSYYTGQSLALNGGLMAQRPCVPQPIYMEGPELWEQRLNP